MSSKAKLNEWCLVRKAKANYSVGQLPNTQLFLCVLDVLTTDGNMHTFTPSKGNTKKKLAENDAAQLALDALLQTKNEKEEYAMILQAISDSIKNPCRNANTAVIELLLEAFELSDGWINAEYFLIFQGVRAAITRADQAARRDNSLCLKILFDTCTAFMVHDPEISKSKVFDVNVVRDTISIERRGLQVFIRRNSPVTSEERELLALYKSRKTIFDDGIYDIADMKLEEEEVDGDNKPISVTAVVLSSDVRTAPHEIKIDLLCKRKGLLTALNDITAKMQCLNVMTVPLYSREEFKESGQYSTGIRIFTKSNAIGSLNKIASWITGSRIVGDVIIGNINLGSLKDFSLTSLSSLVGSSVPSGLLVKHNNDFFSMLPTHFFPYIWHQTEQASTNGSEVSKSESTNQSIANPYTLLFQIVSRRLGSNSLTLRKVTVQEAIKAGDKRAIQYLESVVKREELITVDILSRQNDEEENLPQNPLWNDGIVNPKNTLTKNYTLDQVQKSVKNAINTANPNIAKVEILLPKSLFTVGSTEKITVTMNVQLGGEPLNNNVCVDVHEAVNIAALKCLHLIQDFAEKELKGLPNSVPNESMCRELPVITCAKSVSFVMKIGQDDEKTFSGLFVGCGMIMPQLEKALMNMSVGSTETITFTADQFPSDLLLVTEPVEFKLVDKNEVTYMPQPTKAISSVLNNVKRFSPSLQEQRKRFVSSFLRAVNATSLADLGCGDGSLVLDTLNPLNKLAYVPNMKTISALDINPKRLVTFQKQFENCMAEFPSSLEKLSILEGSITDPYSYDLLCNTLSDNGDHMDGTFDVVSCIEVIEHLQIMDAMMAATFLLLRCRPKYVIFSTPNSEANEAIRLLPLKTLKAVADDRPSEEGKGSFREADHKFEFSRAQFKDWVDELIKNTNDTYRAEFTSVGNLLPGSIDFGGATQIVVLVRKSELSKPEKIDLEIVDEASKIFFSWNSQS